MFDKERLSILCSLGLMRPRGYIRDRGRGQIETYDVDDDAEDENDYQPRGNE